jgi:release factor glutamine methyltransferase
MPEYTISYALKWAFEQLIVKSDTAHLEAEVLLAHGLDVQRSYLHAWPERVLTAIEQSNFVEGVRRCLQGEPIAYITNRREFWSLDLIVTKDTLIPRPETEALVALILEKFPATEEKLIADLGTGSGAIALAIAKERPKWTVYATDRIPAAIDVARLNAKRLRIKNVKFHVGFWFDMLPTKGFDAIISNPPYIAADAKELSPEVAKYEPASALIAGNDGLEDLRHIIQEAKQYLKPKGLLGLEHGHTQARALNMLLIQAGYVDVTTHKDLAGLDRIIMAQKP